MNDERLLKSRIDHGREYLKQLEKSFLEDWASLCEAYLAGKLSLETSMTLIHPDHYQGFAESLDIQGPRAFSGGVATTHLICGSVYFWGYECELGADIGLAADHIFPYSLGGPTIAANRVFLCHYHNQMKSNDIHLFPWEKGKPHWLHGYIQKIARVRQIRLMP